MKSVKSAGYVALGLSDDDKMGRDSVVECINESGSVKAYTSMTVVANKKYDSPRTGIVSHGKNIIDESS
jgi:DOMON domain